jgi:hypothetical protein
MQMQLRHLVLNIVTPKERGSVIDHPVASPARNSIRHMQRGHYLGRNFSQALCVVSERIKKVLQNPLGGD